MMQTVATAFVMRLAADGSASNPAITDPLLTADQTVVGLSVAPSPPFGPSDLAAVIEVANPVRRARIWRLSPGSFPWNTLAGGVSSDVDAAGVAFGTSAVFVAGTYDKTALTLVPVAKLPLIAASDSFVAALNP